MFVHPAAVVETEDIGQNTRIWGFTHVMKNVIIGSNCNVGENCFLESGVKVGNDVTIKNGNMIWDGITIHDGVFVGPGVFFTNDCYPRSPRLPEADGKYATLDWLVPTVIAYGSSIGAGAVILPGITVGNFAMVGAGAVVSKDVPEYALVIGNPARVHTWVCQCGQPLPFEASNETSDEAHSATCTTCECRYQKDGNQITRIKSSH